ncbi:MAG: SDR family NAD(P)-dependent oxidoreductase, partial [Rhodospirillaceae bacterium]|nr:SDR family NAD(P)-dependent oxidoreductase [Rhodospirillaceae bacterium]
MAGSLFSLNGKVAIVTGSTRGIGQSIAESFCKAGAACVVSSEDAAAVDETAARFNGEGYEVAGQHCDVTDEQALARLVDTAVDTFGGLDILVCNAGITGTSGPIVDLEPDDYPGYCTNVVEERRNAPDNS